MFAALPHGAFASRARAFLEAGLRVVDLSADFRLRDAAEYKRRYGLEHPDPDLLEEAVYGLSEWCGAEVEGARCFPDLASVPGELDGIVIATHPDVALEVVRQATERNVPRVWFRRSFGRGSVSEPAVAACRERGIPCIVGGCPLMYREPIDLVHRCMRWWLERRGRIAG